MALGKDFNSKAEAEMKQFSEKMAKEARDKKEKERYMKIQKIQKIQKAEDALQEPIEHIVTF